MVGTQSNSMSNCAAVLVNASLVDYASAMRTVTIAVFLTALCVACPCARANDSAEQPSRKERPATRIMPVDEIRAGMKGYGLSVYRGTRIESFPIEVVTVMHRNFMTAPQGSAIWIRCTDERMKKLGPVAGMSGSPIYLWDEHEPQEPGRGGRLIGAFAFGYNAAKECYVGVRPIEMMRDVATRISDDEQPSESRRAGSPAAAKAIVDALVKVGRAERIDEAQIARAALMAGLISKPGGKPHETNQAPPTRLPEHWQGQSTRLLLPVNLGSQELARALGPLFEPLGLTPTATGGVRSGSPPAWIDADAIQLEPGSVLAVPLAYGDLGFAAVGTVTDVLPDGTVLAFGHWMNNRGASRLPMATGFIDFVMPTMFRTFKVGGSARIVGGLVRDEFSAVAGRLSPRGKFSSAPMTVNVAIPNQKPRRYQYQVVHDKYLTPIVTGVLAAESLTAMHNLESDVTIRVRGNIKLAGDRTLPIDTLVPGGAPVGVIVHLAMPLEIMALNEYETVMPDKVDVSLSVEDIMRSGSITRGRIDRAEARPGENVKLTVWIKRHGEKPQPQYIDFKIPPTVPEGKYEIIVADAKTYLARYFTNRPHAAVATDIDELFDIVKKMTTLRSDALYVTMNLPRKSVAIGREELPKLPSSRKAMIATNTSTLATPYVDWLEKQVPMDVVTAGQIKFKIGISRSLADR